MKTLQEFDYYISPAPESQPFNLHDAHVLFIMSGTGRGMPPIDYITEHGPLQHGGTFIDYRLRPRIITMVTRRRFSCRQDYWDGRDDLLDVLRPNRQAIGQFNPGVLRKILPNGQMRDIEVLIERGPAFEPRAVDRWDERAFTEVLRFVAQDPTFYDPIAQAAEFTLVPTLDNLIFGCVPATPALDTFTDVNGINLEAHVPDVDVGGSGWWVGNGTCDIQGNEARWSVGAADAGATMDPEIADGIVDSDVMVGVATGRAGLTFRQLADNRRWALRLNDNTQRLELRLINLGAWTTEAWVAFAQDEATSYKLSVSMIGGRLQCYIDNVLYIDHFDVTHQAATYHGLYSDNNVNARFDNFAMREGGPCPDPYPDRLVFPIWFGGTAISSYLGITYSGTWLAYPTIVVTGPATFFRIRNLTTNEQLELAYTIALGEVVTFTLEYGNKTVTNQVGDNLIGYLSTDSDLATFHLEPDPGAAGGVNQFHVFLTGGTAGVSLIEVAWRVRYIGI